MEEYFLIKMPAFHPKYKRWKRYGWGKGKEKQNLQDILINESKGYCMYCYRRVFIEHRLYGQIEHAIERSNSDLLTECVPNMGLACTVCNQSLKRIGEKKRRITALEKNRFEQSSSCRNGIKQCTVPCKSLRDLARIYNQKEGAHFILQPIGKKNEISGVEYRIQYNILSATYEPAVDFFTYSTRDIQYIEEHIDRFQLNEFDNNSNALYQFLKIVIDNHGKLPAYEYSNLTVEIFAEKLKSKKQQEILKICETIYCIIFFKEGM